MNDRPIEERVRAVLPSAETQALDPLTRRRIARRLPGAQAEPGPGWLLALGGVAAAALAVAGVVWLGTGLGGSPPIAGGATPVPSSTSSGATPSVSAEPSASRLPSVAPQVGFGTLPAGPSEGSAAGPGRIQFTYRLADGVSLPNLGDGGVRRFVYPPIDLARASDLATRLGFSGPPQTFASPPPTWRWTDGNRSLDIDAARGTVHYAEVPANVKTWTPPPLSPGEAIADARRWLSDHGLLPSDADGGTLVGPADVLFAGEPSVFGTPSSGAFPSIRVQLSSADAVAQLDYRWPAPAGVSRYPLIQPGDLVEALNGTGASQVTVEGLDDQPASVLRGHATVTGVSATTMTSASTDGSATYLIPALRVEGSVLLDDGTTHAFRALYPAVSPDWLAR